MRQRYIAAMFATAGMAASFWGLVSTGQSGLAMIVGSVALPAAVMLLVAGRLELRLPLSGSPMQTADLLDVLRVDPRSVAAASSPWALLLGIEVVAG